MAHPVLNEDWSDYDNKKKRREDRLFFACSERWEVEYLLEKLKKYYPSKTEATILKAIEACCETVAAPRPRETFVTCVTKRLDS